MGRYSVLKSQSRSNLQCHEFLDEKLAGVRNLDLADVRGVLAVVAFEPLLR